MNRHLYCSQHYNQHSPNQTIRHLCVLTLCLVVSAILPFGADAQTKDVGTGCASPVGPIGTATTTSRDYSPTNNYYKYGYTQIIYDPSELGCTGTINAIAFQYAQTTTINRNVEIYMGERATATFSSTSDWTPRGSLQSVFSGTISFSASDWHWINLTSPFSYTGTGYLVVAILDKTGSYTSTNNTFRYSSSSGYKILYARRDGSVYDISTSFTGSQQTNRPNTKFCIDCCTTSRPLSWASTPVASMTYGGTQQLSLAPYTGGGELTWRSSNEDILTVDDEGLVTATGPGTATVTAVLGRDGDLCGASASVDITVTLNCSATITLNGNKEEEISCGTTYCFYDSGGQSGDYSSNESYTATFNSAGEITIRFFEFNSESASYDYMYVYDGDASGEILLNKHGGASLPSPVTMTASSGTMTVVWKTNGYTNSTGWIAQITATGCCPTPRTLEISDCPDGDSHLYDEFDLTATPSEPGGAITWSSSNTSVAEVDENTGHVRLVGLGTAVVKAKIEGYGDLCQAFDRCEITSTCNEAITLNRNVEEEISCGTTYCFYDSGGPDGDYSSSESYTATFTSAGEITIEFFAFTSESASYDYMYIYDGDASGTVLLNKHGGASLPSPAAMTATSGTMTVVWKSDGSGNRAGWTALITAEGCCATPRTLEMDGCPASNQPIGVSFDLTATPSIDGGEITWTSSNTDVATVTGGHVSTVGPGTAVITARIEEVGGLCPARARCEVTVSCGANDKTVGSGTSTNHFYGPVNVAYGYSYRQIIYPKDQLCKGVINGMAFNYAIANPMTIKNDVDIYLCERETSEFANSTDWSLPFDMELVYSGPLDCMSSGWNWLLFNSPYVYSGTKNLVVAIHDKSGTTSSSLYSNFFCTEESTNIQLHVEGSSAYDLSTVNTLTSEYRMKYRPNTKFCIDCCTGDREGAANFKFCKDVIGLNVGGSLTITVDGADEVSPSGTVIYSSGNPDVATVSPDGTVTAVGNGTAIIKATIPAGDPEGYCPVTAKYIVNVGGGLPVYETIGDFVSPPGLYNYFPIDAIFHHTWEQMIFNKSLFENCGCMIKRNYVLLEPSGGLHQQHTYLYPLDRQGGV